MLAHIYSYCDTPTLAVLSLVSFGSWEMASPPLYEHVEITSLDSLKPLFFLVRLIRLLARNYELTRHVRRVFVF